MKTSEKKKNTVLAKPASKVKTKVAEHHIRQRAFEIYVSRNNGEGTEATDWSQAEQELNCLY